MFSKVICHKGFWPSVVFLSLMFVVIYNVADIFMAFDGSFTSFLNERLSSENLLKFISANIASGFVYGFIVSFFKFRSKIKKQSQNSEQ